MKQIVQDMKKGEISIAEVPVPVIKENCILVKNYFSLISVGTEKLMMEFAKKSLIGKARARPDLVKQVMQKVKKDGLRSTLKRAVTRLELPSPIGYSCSGEIVEIGLGVSGFRVGDKVACAGAGYANHAEYIVVPKNLCVKIPENVNLDEAAFTTVGSIALHGVRTAEINLDENVGVLGLGLIGQITVRLLKACGCSVFGFDIDKRKVDFANKSGIDCCTHNSTEVDSLVNQMTKEKGLDCVLITASTSGNGPIVMAGEISRDKGRVVAVGAVNLDIPRRIFYNKEVDLRISRSYGPGRYDASYEEKGIDYPIGYVRWTENRNMETVLNLIQRNKLDVKDLMLMMQGKRIAM
jgi:threonine dehydrogenase-like Zn-dependent dehydrogenase